MMKIKQACGGYHGVCHSQYADESGMLPIGEFSTGVIRDGKGYCRSCRDVVNLANPQPYNPIAMKVQNARRPIWYRLAGSMQAYYDMTDAARKIIRELAVSLGLVTGATSGGTRREATIQDPHRHTNTVEYTQTTITGPKRKRNKAVVNDVGALYDTCCIEGCPNDIFDVAHIYGHRHANSSDTADNMLPLCPNHHTALDRGRMYITQDLDITWWTASGEVIEHSKIVLHPAHTVDTAWAEKQMTHVGFDIVNKEASA